MLDIPTVQDVIRKHYLTPVPEPNDVKGWKCHITSLRKRISKLEQTKRHVEKVINSFDRAIERETDRLEQAIDTYHQLTD